ncbi:MAG TPA: hypothetical protein VG347_07080 [Verrucomicrobiae bacterium]|nr:hypothetical protein [Verrucomicrobiae bacterium]
MKTTKQRLINIVITMSVAVNLVLLGGLGYIATLDNHVDRLYTAINTPVVVYFPKAVAGPEAATSIKSPATQ